MTKDFNLLRLLVVLNEERQTVLAAKRLHLSQPTISVMLRKLRDQFNDPLFVRDKNRLEPTLRCQELLEQLPGLLDGLDALYVDESEWDISQVSGELSLLFSPPLMSTLAVPLITRITEQAPHATVECYHWAFDAVRDLELKRRSWGFSYLPMPTNKNILQKDIGNDEFVMVMRNDHPLVSPTVEDALKYLLCTNLIYGENESSRSEKIIKNLDLAKHIQVRTSDISMLLGLLDNTDFISITSKHNMARFKGRYRFEPLPSMLRNEARYRQFSLFTHQRNRIDPLTNWLFEQASDIMSDAVV